MFKIEYKYAGQPYPLVHPPEIQAMAEQLKVRFEIQLRPFEAELTLHDATITVEILPDNSGSVSVTDIPKDLETRITIALKEVIVSVISNSRVCIFCNSENDGACIEHIVPESFGNTWYVVPRGSVCCPCNSRFSKFEDKALSNSIFVMQRAIAGVLTKKGKPANGKVSGLQIKGIQGRGKEVEVGGIQQKDIYNIDVNAGTFELLVQPFEKSEVSVSKLLLKMGFEAIYTSQRAIYKKYDFSELKSFLLGKGADWPFITSLATFEACRSIPTMNDKYRFNKLNCTMMYRVVNEEALLFEFHFGGVQMTINLLNRSRTWILEYDAFDPNCYAYPEHYQKHFPKMRERVKASIAEANEKPR